MTTNMMLNKPNECVDDALAGLISSVAGVIQLKGHRVILREDVEQLKREQKVTLLSGGGSGHEPAHAGYVGKGMLTGSIAGSVFTSPPTKSILAAIKAVGTGNSAGTLLIVKSYTGDRLNFGIAAERAKAEGLRVEMIVVGEDCALSSENKMAGRRGLCGTILIHKVAGALAEDGKSLEEIIDVATRVANSMGTISVSLSPCSLPGSGPSFELGHNEMELGLGIHGEAGIKRIKLLSACDTVATMLDHMTDASNRSRLAIKDGDHVALVINNLGGTSYLELNIVAKEAIEYLVGKGVSVDRVYCGTFMTSLQMAGVSVTIMHLDNEGMIVKYLDKETAAVAWPKISTCPVGPCKYLEIPDNKVQMKSGEGTQGYTEEFQVLSRAVKAACDAICSQEEHLNELDRGGGDGDTGSTLKIGAEGILSWLSTQKTPLSPSSVSMQFASIAEDVMGGSSGALYSIFFTAASRVLKPTNNLQSYSEALKEGMDAMMKYGGAEIGDRTMLDSLNAVYKVLSQDGEVGSCLADAAKAAEEMAEKTKNMVARAGRASYVSSEKVTNPDPGAVAVAVWVRAVANSMC
ncbi:triokinase/FMN cyclase-like [Anneissia japonica]|uniref:triokinase/FMN cyclase-like n=1 Tax=Anneissia japonica TaxID=1529436 RepID=UPI0014257A1A|nr:triokinase/FMN cyclase-like [Anneissia japonica]